MYQRIRDRQIEENCVSSQCGNLIIYIIATFSTQGCIHQYDKKTESFYYHIGARYLLTLDHEHLDIEADQLFPVHNFCFRPAIYLFLAYLKTQARVALSIFL